MRHHQIYFLQRADGLIKIGTSITFAARLAQLTASHGMLGVVRVINGDQRRERELHRKFKRFHEYGEWFRDERGALTAAIMELPEGSAVAVAASDTKAAWMAGEEALMERVRNIVDDMISTRRQRYGETREASLAALSSEYGLPPSFLVHVASGRATTISAYGFERLRQARQSEMQSFLDHLRREVLMLTEAGPSDDAVLLALGQEIEALDAELRSRRAAKIAARKAALK